MFTSGANSLMKLLERYELIYSAGKWSLIDDLHFSKAVSYGDFIPHQDDS